MRKSRLSRPILLIKTGATIPETREEFGDFEDWFERGLGMPGMEQVNVYSGEQPSDPGEYSGVVVTGSAAMVSHRHDWSERTGEWLAKAVHGGMPVLGVCFGHQLMAHALGGVVGPNPNGRQIGTQPIEILPAAYFTLKAIARAPDYLQRKSLPPQGHSLTIKRSLRMPVRYPLLRKCGHGVMLRLFVIR